MENYPTIAYTMRRITPYIILYFYIQALHLNSFKKNGMIYVYN